MSLQERLDKIRTQNANSKLTNQQQVAVVLSAVEDTLKTQQSELTPTAYFAALLALLPQQFSGSLKESTAAAVVYLLDIVTPHTPAPLLRSKFSQILKSLAPALTHQEAEAPLIRSSIGCIESLLVVQDAQAWTLSHTEVSASAAVAALLNIAMDPRPKVKNRALEALTGILGNPPPTPRLDHPAANMCAESATRTLRDVAEAAADNKKHRAFKEGQNHDSGLIHALQLIETVAKASGGWPSTKINDLCELLLSISRSSNAFLVEAVFKVFELVFASMISNDEASPKLPGLLQAIKALKPSVNDDKLAPSWLGAMSMAYDTAGQAMPDEAFEELPELFATISSFLTASAYNIRVSAAECLKSLLVHCVPKKVIEDPAVYEEKMLETIARKAIELLSVKYQAAWIEVFDVLTAMFEALKWRSSPMLDAVVKTVGELHDSKSFTGKDQAKAVIRSAIKALGPAAVLEILPLNFINSKKGAPQRGWLLVEMSHAVSNTRIAHFRETFVTLSEEMNKRVPEGERTAATAALAHVVNQCWFTFPGYCELPLDVVEAVDGDFLFLLSELLYKRVDLRTTICRGLHNLVESNKAILALEGPEDLVVQRRISRAQAQQNLDHVSQHAENLLAVLFNVYVETLPQNRAGILRCIDEYMSILSSEKRIETFNTVTQNFESTLAEAGSQTQADKQRSKDKDNTNKMPPASHTLMDLLITLAVYLPRESFQSLFRTAAKVINNPDDSQLQKKAYKLIPRLYESEVGSGALKDNNTELQQFLISSGEKACAASKRDRIAALAVVVRDLADEDLHFIPTILSEVVISAKEVNERARAQSFELIGLMGEKMAAGGTVVNSKVPHMPNDAPSVEASLEEYLTMLSAGLVGSTPNMVSASITAITAVIYHFHAQLSEAVITDLVKTMDLFLTSNNREIVSSVLGFVKVAITSLPKKIMLPRLQDLMRNLMIWSHEHKGRFKAKVKHIVERMMRVFGNDVVERNCPDEDRKLIANIRKTKARRKRGKDAAKAGADEEEGDSGDEITRSKQAKEKFDSGFEEALASSDDEDDDQSDVEFDDRGMAVKTGKDRSRKKGDDTYIVEDDDEPLDLLSRNALGHFSNTKPSSQSKKERSKRAAETDEDGKLVFREPSKDAAAHENGDEDADMLDANADNGTLEQGINAYVDAIRGGPQRGQRGKYKFKNALAKGKEDANNDDGAVDVDEAELVSAKKAAAAGKANGVSPRGKMGGMKARPGVMQKKPIAVKAGRRGLGVAKQRVSSGRVGKR